MINYFSQFPTSFYDFGDTERNIINVWNRTHYKLLGSFNFADLCQKYVINDGENPTDVSMKLYGTQDYYWTFFVVNVRRDYVRHFPMTEQSLIEYCKEKYGPTQWTEGVHHYEDRRGFVVDSAYLDIDGYTVRRGIPVSNFAYEQKENEKRRHIYVIKPYYVSKFAANFMGTMNV